MSDHQLLVTKCLQIAVNHALSRMLKLGTSCALSSAMRCCQVVELLPGRGCDLHASIVQRAETWFLAALQ